MGMGHDKRHSGHKFPIIRYPLMTCACDLDALRDSRVHNHT